MKQYSDAEVNDCAERLSQLGIPVNGSTNPKVGYIKNPMACERCIYGSGEHAGWCVSRPHIPFDEATKDYNKGTVGKWIVVNGHVLEPGETISDQLTTIANGNPKA